MSTTAGEKYTHGHHESVLRSHSWRTVDNSAAYLVPYLKPGVSLLDVGCGPGTITLDFAERVAPGRVVGMDASAEVIAKAAADGAAVTNAEFVVGNAYALDFADDTFDVVHAHQVLQHVGDPVAMLKEMRRVLKPGGVVGVREVDYKATAIHPLTPGLAKWESTYQAVHRSNGGEPDAGRRLKSWALAAGFAEVEATASVWCFASDADREWWGGSWAVRSLESNFATDALSKGLATQADLDEISAAWTAWAADPDGTFIMPHGEILARG